MSFYKASKKAEDIKQGGTNHIVASGVYPVTILAPIVNESGKGSTTIDLYVEHNGQKQIIYGNLRITNNDGSTNKIGSKVFNQLLIIADLDEVDEPEEMELPIGKKEKMQPAAVLTELMDLEVLMRVQMEYSVYNGNIQEKKVIKTFFRAEDKATAEEIVNEADYGKGYEAESPYFDNITYKDGTTPESIAAWRKAGRPKGTGNGGTGDTGNSGPAKKVPFGKKRPFGKKKAEETEDADQGSDGE
jgi:hypothetical protein